MLQRFAIQKWSRKKVGMKNKYFHTFTLKMIFQKLTKYKNNKKSPTKENSTDGGIKMQSFIFTT